MVFQAFISLNRQHKSLVPFLPCAPLLSSLLFQSPLWAAAPGLKWSRSPTQWWCPAGAAPVSAWRSPFSSLLAHCCAFVQPERAALSAGGRHAHTTHELLKHVSAKKAKVSHVVMWNLSPGKQKALCNKPSAHACPSWLKATSSQSFPTPYTADWKKFHAMKYLRRPITYQTNSFFSSSFNLCSQNQRAKGSRWLGKHSNSWKI